MKSVARSCVSALFVWATLGGSLSACAVSESDVHKWEGTVHGPEKLVAVVTHDKYRPDLRKEAAMSLVRMPPRGGTRQGIKLLIDKHKDESGEEQEGALTGLAEETRMKIIDLMAPELIAELQKPPPPRTEAGRAAPDPTVPYKDITFAMLVHEPPLVTKADTREKLEAALVQWAQTGFEDRIENSSQQFGLEQMMRTLGPRTATKLPSLITENAYRVDRMAGLIAEIGDADTKLKGSEALVALAKRIETADWVEAQKKVVADYNKRQNVTATPEQVVGQVKTMQDRKFKEELFPAMKRVGQKPINEYLFAQAATGTTEERRTLALAALEGKPDKNNPQDLERLFAIAKDDATPDGVRDLAFARLAELPKEQILPKLYTLFEPKKWKVRWVAASLVLRTISTKQVPDFMGRLPKTSKTKMGMTEGLSYGGLIAKMEPTGSDPKPRDVIMPFLSSPSFGAKMTAIGFFYEGKKADAHLLKRFEDDKDALPKCDKEEECAWACAVPKAGTQEKELKEISSVGELVRLCVVPSMDK
jgi:hypothetical protein